MWKIRYHTCNESLENEFHASRLTSTCSYYLPPESRLGSGFFELPLGCLCPFRFMPPIIEYILSISHNFISPVTGSCIDSSVPPASSVPTISHVLSCETSNLSWIVEMRVKNPFLEFLSTNCSTFCSMVRNDSLRLVPLNVFLSTMPFLDHSSILWCRGIVLAI